MLNIFSNKFITSQVNLFTSTKEINFSISMLNIFSNKFITSQINLFTSTKEINFSISKHNTLYIKWKGLGLISLIEKLFKNISPFKNYLWFVKGKAIFGYLWAVPQLFSACLRILKNKCAPVLEWAWSNPPKPHAFTSLALQSSSWGEYLELVDTSRPAERRGIYQFWRKDIHGMSLQERIYHVKADIDYYEDRVSTEPNSSYIRNVTALKNELEGLRLLIPVQPPQPVVQPPQPVEQPPQPVVQPPQPVVQPPQPVEQPPQPVVQPPQPVEQPPQPVVQPPQPVEQPPQPVEQPPQPVQRHPSGWTPINWNRSQQDLLVFLTTSRLTVSPFVRFIITIFIPFFGVITSLVLSVLIITNPPFISDIYAWLTSILGNDIMSGVDALFFVIFFLIKLLLMIRKANKSAVLYDRLFSFAAKHYSSGILYFFILLLSVGLVYLCV